MDKEIQIQGYEIIVIQSLKKGELETGNSLYNGVLKYKQIVKEDIISRYYSISSRNEFAGFLRNI